MVERELEGQGMSISRGYRWILALALALLGVGPLAAPGAVAKEFPYTLEPRLSLTGDCSTSGADPTPDPDCPYPSPPEGPIGRFDRPGSVAVDDWGNLYVASRSGDGTAGRVDIFDPEGHFISELADPYGPQSIAVDGEGNLYAYEALIGVQEAPTPKIVRYPPATYNPAAGEIKYEPAERTTIAAYPAISFLFNGLGIDRRNPLDPADDRLFIAEDSRISEYGSAKEGNGLKATITPAGLSSAMFAEVDSQRRRLYTTECKEGLKKCVAWVLEADPPYSFLKEIDGSTTSAGRFFSDSGKLSLAVDETNGHLFVGDLAATDDIYEFDASYEFASTFAIPGGPVGQVQSAVASNPKNPDPADENPADNYRHLFVPLSNPSGSAIAFAPPDVQKPEIKGTAATGIGETEAELEATIDPNQADTTYTLEYTRFDDTAYTEAVLAKSGTILGTSPAKRVSVLIGGLEPNTAYRFRVTAENEVDEAEPEEVSFTTFDDGPIPIDCSNQTLRIGPSAGLPDCRVYELVTPADTNGRAPIGGGFEGERFGALQSSPEGGAVSFEIQNGSLAGTEATGSFYGDPYVATRSSEGWSSALAGPTGTESSKVTPGSFSPDQGHMFWTASGTGSAVVGSPNATYVRYSDGRSELIGRGSLGTEPRARGRLITEDATHIVFETSDSGDAAKLEPEAPEAGINTVYDRTTDEVTHVVSLLPGNLTPAKPAVYLGASADGEGIAFEVDRTLYLRKNNEITYEIGEEKIGTAEEKEEEKGLAFAGVSEGGERIFYREAGDFKAFDTTTNEVIVFADTTAKVKPVNVAPEGSRAYFVSEDAIPGSGPNPNDDEPQPGEQNLYMSEGGGTPAFVATLTERDVAGVVIEGNGIKLDGLGLWMTGLEKRRPAIDPSRLTPDGDVLVFQSRANLDHYEPGGFPQVYRYDHDAGRLHCVSCSPTKTPASGGAVLQSLGFLDSNSPLTHYGFVPALRPDGDRVFFESTEALVSDDTDELRDVYEWEEEGVGSCVRPGGCVYLISSGQSGHDDYLFGHSQSGDDVFIHTADVLVPGDQATISIYDAKVGGGFATAEPVVCRDEGSCRPAPTPPPAPLVSPPPRVIPASPAKKCPRGKRRVKRKGKVVCVKKRKNHRKAKGGAGK